MAHATAGERFVPRPAQGRVYTSSRLIRLSDMDPTGRLRLDAVARFLQDVAIEDVDETGWGAPTHLWFVRRYELEVVTPFREDRAVELATWCSGMAPLAAGRRTSVEGDRGGRIEVDSVWIHLGPDQRPARLDDFGVYRVAAGERRVSTKLRLPDPLGPASGIAWPVRATEIDLHGHLNNAAYWGALEERLLAGAGGAGDRLRATLEYRAPIDLGDEVLLREHAVDGALELAFVVNRNPRAVARIEPFVASPGKNPSTLYASNSE